MNEQIPHYYGDTVRYLFMSAGFLMLISLPLFQGAIRLPTLFSIIAIVVLGLAAGLTNPKQASSAVINLAIALIGLIVFSYYSVNIFNEQQTAQGFFFINIVLAIAFLFATYYGVKTVRGFYLR